MRKMKLIAIALVALAGCAKQDYSDPIAFLEHYGQEMLAKSFPKMDELGFDKFAFHDAKVGIEQYQGEYVSAIFEAVPKSGVKIHRIIRPRLIAVDCSLPHAPSERFYGKDVEERLRQIGTDLNAGVFAPLFYRSEVLAGGFDAEKNADALRLRIYRAKGSDGILRPVTGRDAIALYMGEGGKTKCDFSLEAFLRRWSGEIANEEYLKKRKAMPLETNVFHNAIAEYNTHVTNITNAFRLLRRTIDVGDFNELFAVGDESPKLREMEEVHLAVEAERKIADEAEKKFLSIRNMAPNVEKSAKVVRDLEASLREMKLKLERATAQREKAHERVEKLSAQVAENRRSRRRDSNNLERAKNDLIGCENNVAEIAGRISDLERRLMEAKRTADEGQATYNKFFESKEYTDAKDAMTQTQDRLMSLLLRENNLRIEAERECVKILVDKAIDIIFSEVEALNAAIGIESKGSTK